MVQIHFVELAFLRNCKSLFGGNLKKRIEYDEKVNERKTAKVRNKTKGMQGSEKESLGPSERGRRGHVERVGGEKEKREEEKVREIELERQRGVHRLG